jgi:hypothetical protein
MKTVNKLNQVYIPCTCHYNDQLEDIFGTEDLSLTYTTSNYDNQQQGKSVQQTDKLVYFLLVV